MAVLSVLSTYLSICLSCLPIYLFIFLSEERLGPLLSGLHFTSTASVRLPSCFLMGIILSQVDTSGEDTKSGVTAEEAVDLAKHILSDCSHLKFAGVMTIGAPGDMTCFDKLVDARKLIATATGLDAETLELSMGMSGDFEEAISRGSTNVRVGSSIFGAREYPKKT